MSQSSYPDVQALINELISKDKVVIFSKTYCPYCTLAKEVFQKLNEAFAVIELDKRDDGPKIQSGLASITGVKTVPQVFLKGKFIGGGSDVKKLFDTGKLQTMLA